MTIQIDRLFHHLSRAYGPNFIGTAGFDKKMFPYWFAVEYGDGRETRVYLVGSLEPVKLRDEIEIFERQVDKLGRIPKSLTAIFRSNTHPTLMWRFGHGIWVRDADAHAQRETHTEARSI